MGMIAKIEDQSADAAPVALMLNGGRVTRAFRDALFAAVGREGVTVNEFVLRAAGEKLAGAGNRLPGVFRAGDLEDQTKG
jgi:hypothetical protein